MRALAEVRGSQRVTDPEAEQRYQSLEKYTRDLTELARKGKLDPVIGRDEAGGSQRVTDPEAEQRYQSLEKYTRDLTELARKGKLDPVIGRDEEVRRSMQ